MKKALHCLLILTGLFFATRISAQELVYEQDHGLSFNKGTINTDVLIQLIQEKQEELNKFMLSNLMKKAVEKNSESRLNNFTTKYLIYKTMNELVVSADKSKFGKQTLELVKEAAVIFGISALANDQFGDLHLASNLIKEDDKLGKSEFRDSISFNETLDMVLNACIENPEMAIYFPLYGKLSNADDPDRVWYESESDYWSNKDSLQNEYESIVSIVEKVVKLRSGIDSLSHNLSSFPKGVFPSLERRANAIIAGDSSDTLIAGFQQNLQSIFGVMPQSLIDFLPEATQTSITDVKGYVADTEKIRSEITKTANLIDELKNYYEAIKSRNYLDLFAGILKVLPGKDKDLSQRLTSLTGSNKNFVDSKIIEKPVVAQGISVYKQLENLNTHFLGADTNLGFGFVAAVRKLEYDYANWERSLENHVINANHLNQLMDLLEKYKIRKDTLKKIKSVFDAQLMQVRLDSNSVRDLMSVYLRTKKSDKWFSELRKAFMDNNGFLSYKDLENFIDKHNCQLKKLKEPLSDLRNTLIWFEKSSVYQLLKAELKSDELNKLLKNSTFKKFAEESESLLPEKKDITKLEEEIKRLHNLAERSGIAQLVINLASQLEKEGSLKGFLFEKEQVELTKDIMNYYIDYVSESGEFSIGSVFLKTLVDNISYKEADTLERTSASISLSFESVLFTLNDKIVMPEWSYRMRRFQPFIQIGVNYADFVGSNKLDFSDDGTARNLYAMSFASEKIGLKFKLMNWAYTRSFSPGVIYKWNNKYYQWIKPPKMPFFNEWYIDFHAGGLLYNAVNLNTEKEFDFPFVGLGSGVKTFNGLSVSASYNFPFTNRLAQSGAWLDNSFWMLSIDIPIIEYISALRKK